MLLLQVLLRGVLAVCFALAGGATVCLGLFLVYANPLFAILAIAIGIALYRLALVTAEFAHYCWQNRGGVGENRCVAGEYG